MLTPLCVILQQRNRNVCFVALVLGILYDTDTFSAIVVDGGPVRPGAQAGPRLAEAHTTFKVHGPAG